MSTYLDSSFLVSLYTPDSNHEKGIASLETVEKPLFVSDLSEFEAMNAFRLRVFRKEAIPHESRQSIDDLELDLKTKAFERLQMPNQSFRKAHEISSQHTAQLGIRAADILHVAIALEVGSEYFSSFDLQQRKLASAAGLKLNPL